MNLHKNFGRRILISLVFALTFLPVPGTALASQPAAPIQSHSLEETVSSINSLDKETAALLSESTDPVLPSSGLPALPSYRNSAEYPLARASLPTRYDSRSLGLVTPVKNQDPWGSCWAFGTLSAGESSLIKKKLADTSIDLSEMHLTYFFFQCPADPLGLTKNDTVRNNTGENFLNTGGNNLFTMFALSKWLGAAPESLVPYSNTSSINPAYAYQDTAHLQNARFVNTADMNSVKNLIMQYGAVSTSIYYHPTFENENGAYLFPVSNFSTNHIVSIVGWDDNYSRDNFEVIFQGRKIKPSINGAWIVKNSYGTSGGDQGYLYISYQDASCMQTSGDYLSYAFDMERADNYDHNYQYDGSFGSGYISAMNGTSIANVYKINANSGKNEQLKAVSFSLFSQNVNYSIQIYKNPSSGNPSSGSPVFSTPQTGTTTYSGYYTIPLKEQPVFNQGDTFSVVITLKSSAGGSIDYFVDQTSSSNAELQFVSNSSKNQSFYKSAATDDEWIDHHSLGSGKTARIKAFTVNTTKPATKVELITNTLKRPTLSYLKRVSSSKVRLKWRSVKNAKKYEIYRSTKKNSGYRKIATTSKTTFTNSKLTPGATYYYKIRARRTLNGAPAYSKHSSAKSVKLTLSAPRLISAKASGKKNVKVKWTKISGVKGYEVFRSTSKKRGFKKVKTLGKTSFTDKPSKKRTYYYKVRCYNIVSKKKVYSSFSSVIKSR